MQSVRDADRAAPRGDAAAARSEFGAMFVSLAGPAGLLDMEKCLEVAGRMGDAASRSGYGAGERMAASLAGIFADVAEIVNRPVDDGALDSTYDAFRSMMGVLFGAGEEYRSGGDPEPAGRLEEVREDVARFRSWADARREKLRKADPPGSGLVGLSLLHRGQICRDVVREGAGAGARGGRGAWVRPDISGQAPPRQRLFGRVRRP